MNTPSSKRPVRGGAAKLLSDIKHLDGTYSGELTDTEFLQYFALFLTGYQHLEDHMVDVLASLLNDNIHTARADANVIFRSVINAKDRIRIIRNLLQESTKNVKKPAFYDEVIDEFESLTKTRNEYVHGLWWSHHETGRVFLVSPQPTYFPSFFERREVKKSDMKHNINRLRKLDWKILLELHKHHKAGLPGEPRLLDEDAG